MKQLLTLSLSVLLCAPGLAFAQAVQAVPQRFGGNVLSNGEVFRGSFSPDGNSFYFFRKVIPNQEEYRIFVSHRNGDNWSAPERVVLGGDYSDTYPALSKDGNRLVFSSYRPAPGDTSHKPNAHLWYVDREGNGWGRPVFMKEASKLGHYHSWVEFGYDGGIYFRRTTPDWSSNETLVSRWRNGSYGAAEPVAALSRWKNWRSDVRVAGASFGPTGDQIFLDVATSNPQTGRPASDIWVSLKRGDGWTDPKPLGAGVNTDGFDVFPFFSPSGRDMYFVRDFSAFYHVPLNAALSGVR